MLDMEKALHVDIPVELNELKLVFSVSSLMLEGDLPGLCRDKFGGVRNSVMARSPYATSE